MKNKILFVHHSSVIGGASWCLFEILKHLDRDRFEPVVLLNEDGPLVGRIQSLDISVEVDQAIPMFPIYAHGQIRGCIRFLKALLIYPKKFKIFYMYCRRIAPDVVYLNSSAQLFLPWPSKKAGVKKVIFHNREHWDPRGILKVKLLMRKWIVARYVDEVFSITECGAKAIGFLEKSTVVRDWPSFDDETEINVREKLRIASDTFLILLTGGLMPIKGTRDVLQALSLMQTRKQVAVVVLGCSEWQDPRWKSVVKKILRHTSYAAEVKEMADASDNIFLLPPTLQVKTYMRQCNVLVAPFIMPHAAKAALEMQHMNHPVVLYESAEAREYGRHEETGLFVPREDVQALAAALDDLVRNPEKAHRMGVAGGEFVRNGFSAEKSMEKISAAFQLNG